MDTPAKKKWRFEIISPNSSGARRVIDEFDDDKLSLFQEQVDIMVQHEGVWESRIVPND
jgi:hypothetical protein